MSRSLSRGKGRLPGKAEAAHIQAMCQACEQVLVPISREFLNLGLGVGLFLQAAKHAYIQAAADAIRQSGQRPSVSRIAALTGMQRKEIKLLSTSAADEAQAIQRLPPFMRVVSAWRADGEFCGPDGKPKSLSVEDGQGSFRSLVERYAGDVTHVAVLRELQRLAWVKRTKKGEVVLTSRLQDLKILGVSAAEFANRISAYATALCVSRAPGEAAAYAAYREAPPMDVRVGAALAKTFSKRADEFLAGFERWVSRSNRHSSANPANPMAKFSMGVYFLDNSLQRPVEVPVAPKAKPTPRAKRA